MISSPSTTRRRRRRRPGSGRRRRRGRCRGRRRARRTAARSALQVGRAAAVVDVQAVGLGVDRDDRRRRPRGRRAGAAADAAPWAQSTTTVSPSSRCGGGLDQRGAGSGPARRRRRRPGRCPRRSGRLPGPGRDELPRCGPRWRRRACARRRAKILMPLSGIGLCDAEIITPKSASYAPVRYATAGVGSTPTRSTSAPALVRPATTAASSISPLARGSRPTTASGGVAAVATRPARARPRPRAPAPARGSDRALATPADPVGAEQSTHAATSDDTAIRAARTAGATPVEEADPAVRQTTRAGERSALRVLRRLAGLLQAVLLALVGPRVTGEEAGLLQRRAVVGLAARSARGRWPGAARRPGRRCRRRAGGRRRRSSRPARRSPAAP